MAGVYYHHDENQGGTGTGSTATQDSLELISASVIRSINILPYTWTTTIAPRVRWDRHPATRAIAISAE